jgi:hypothetical protein
VADKRGMQLPIDLFRDLTRFKIRLAGDLGAVPTNPEVVRALLAIAEANYPATVAKITEIRKGE